MLIYEDRSLTVTTIPLRHLMPCCGFLFALVFCVIFYWFMSKKKESDVIAMAVEFFVFSVDYSRTEYAQFEDDEYYYYVKAVPKMSIAVSDKQVKRINTRRRTGQRKRH